MPSYPVPDNEKQRLLVLHDLAINYSAPLEEVQRLTEIASRIAGTPIALVSIVDADVQHFIARTGLSGISGTSRDVSFCAHAILDQGQFVVCDARDDVRFCQNPLVSASPAIRAYAGSVLEAEPGIHVGTLCVIDTKPRSFSDDVLQQLEHLAGCVTTLLRGHRDRLTLRDRLMHEAHQHSVLRDLANRDPLTGLLNQAGFRARLEERLKATAGTEALAIIDVDYFKQVNDRWGHPYGDRYLKLIADGLAAGLGPDAIVGRIGGDEFAALLPSGSTEAHLTLMEVARLGIRGAVIDIAKPNLGKLSIGLCSAVDAPERTFEALYQRADVALYASKDRGRNTTSVFSQELDSRYNLRILRARFSESLDAGEVEAFFQPKLTLANAKVCGFELLARWRDKRRGLLTPAYFEKLLLDPTIAPELTHHMIGAAIDAHLDMRRRGLSPVRLAVNVTHFDLSNPLFVEETDWRLAEAGLDWTCLDLEVTERAILADTDLELRHSLTMVREMGALIALDDFGTGHAGLIHLRDWPIDVLKLDKAFVRDIAVNQRDEAIVASIVDLAHRLGIAVTAEGIESSAVSDKLLEMGCEEGQGFLFAPGLAWEKAVRMLAERAA